MTTIPFRLLALLLLVPFLTTACDGDDDGGSGSGTTAGSTDVLITDATMNQLMTFNSTVESVQLVSDTGVMGDEMLSTNTPIEFIGASSNPRFVGRTSLPAGTFRGVQVRLARRNITAMARDGSDAEISAGQTTVEFPFATNEVIGSGAQRQLLLDLDLGESLTGDVTSPPLNFASSGSARLTSGPATSSDIGAVNGRVMSQDDGAGSFEIDAFGDADSTQGLGHLRVDTLGNTLFVDRNGSQFPDSEAFFSTLTEPNTRVEVRGQLEGGRLMARRAEIVDGPGGPTSMVRMHGRIEGRIGRTSTLRVLGIEQGASMAMPAINGKKTITIQDADDMVVMNGVDTFGSASDLRVGQRVEARFAQFANAPYEVQRMEIRSEPEFEGRITNLTGAGPVPTSMTIRLHGTEPAIMSGEVFDSSTPITVDLGGMPLVLGTPRGPKLDAEQLMTGLQVEVLGAISGENTSPTIVPSRIRIHPGRMHGRVTATNPTAHSFTAVMQSLDDSFGDGVTFGQIEVEVDADCTFSDDVQSEAQFYSAFENLERDQNLNVRIYGIGTTTANRIKAFRVRSSID